MSPFVSARCESCQKLTKIGKLAHYERIWAKLGSVQKSYNIMKDKELPQNVPSVHSWKRHIANHVKVALQEESSEWVVEVVQERQRQAGALVDEINTNLTTCRNLSNRINEVMNKMLKRIEDRDATTEEIRSLTILNNSVTKQISEIRQTLQLVHKLRGEFEITEEDQRYMQAKFAEIMDNTLTDEQLMKMRKELKDAGISGY